MQMLSNVSAKFCLVQGGAKVECPKNPRLSSQAIDEIQEFEFESYIREKEIFCILGIFSLYSACKFFQ